MKNDPASNPHLFRHIVLRERAEKAVDSTLVDIGEASREDVQKLVYELQVHQIELEMQNEELLSSQEELEATRARYANLYDLSPVGLLALGPRREVVEANPAAARLLSAARSDLIGQKLSRFIAPESQDALYLLCRGAVKEHLTGAAEVEVATRRDGPRVLRIEAAPGADPTTGKPLCNLSLTDVTAAKALEAEKALVAAIVESSDDAILSRDLNNLIITWNPAAERIFGYTAAEIIGQSFAVLVSQDRIAEAAMRLHDLLQGKNVGSYETVYVAKDGRSISVSAAAWPIRNAAGKVVGISTALRDISRQKEAEASLAQTEHELAEFFDQSPVAIFWVGPGGSIDRVNAAAMDLFGARQDDCVGHDIREFHIDSDVVSGLLNQLAEGRPIQNRRVRVVSRDGTLKHGLVDATGLWANNKLIRSQWFVRNISHRVKLEQELLDISERERQRIAQDLHDGLGQLLSGMIHMASALAHQLQAKSLRESADIARIFDLLNEALAQTRSMVRGLHPVRPEPNGLMVALQDLADRTKTMFKCDCRFLCPRPVLIEDITTATHLYRIAQEAVTNAVKHGSAKRIRIGLTRTPERVSVTIRDNGAGLPDGPLRSNGMGMYIMNYRAGVIGGSLVIQKQPRGGTVVVCTVRRPPRTKELPQPPS